MNADSDSELVVQGYAGVLWRRALATCAVLLTLGLAKLVFYWLPHWELRLTHRPVSLAQAEKVLITVRHGAFLHGPDSAAVANYCMLTMLAFLLSSFGTDERVFGELRSLENLGVRVRVHILLVHVASLFTFSFLITVLYVHSACYLEQLSQILVVATCVH